MRSLAVLALLCAGLAGCGLVASPPPEPVPSPSSSSSSSSSPAAPPPQAELVDGFVVIRKDSGSDQQVSVFNPRTGSTLWSVLGRPADPVVKSRIAQGSIVAARRSGDVEVYDLPTGRLRFTKEKVGALGISWTTLFAGAAQCQPDCLLRAYDLATGAERWTGPQSMPGNVLVEPGEPADAKFDPPGRFSGPMRASVANAIAVRGTDSVVLLDATTGQELSKVAKPERAMALGSDKTLLEWGDVKDCELRVTATDVRTGELKWSMEMGARTAQRPAECVSGWRPTITDRLTVWHSQRGVPRVIEVDSGKDFWSGNTASDPMVTATRQVVFTYALGRLYAFNAEDARHLWTAENDRTARLVGFAVNGGRVIYALEYPGSADRVGFVRDLLTGKRMWYGHGATPLAVDGDRLVVEDASGVRVQPIGG
ncbi:MAG TPA: PQQ-binding-like beta-propeller repeat protein [Candidatus Limnocylindrales bacterium]